MNGTKGAPKNQKTKSRRATSEVNKTTQYHPKAPENKGTIESKSNFKPSTNQKRISIKDLKHASRKPVLNNGASSTSESSSQQIIFF